MIRKQIVVQALSEDNGHRSAKTTLRTTCPDINQLSPLACWLVEHLPDDVSDLGNCTDPARQVRCYNGKTRGEVLREHIRDWDSDEFEFEGMHWKGPDAKSKMLSHVEQYIATYGMDDQPACIPNWSFGVILPNMSNEEYWELQAFNIIHGGITRVEINDQHFNITRDTRSKLSRPSPKP